MYELPPFEETFQPMRHNKYLMRRNDVVSRFVTRALVTIVTCPVSRYSTSQGYYQQAAHRLAQADQSRLIAERLGAAFTWGRAVYEGCLIGQGISGPGNFLYLIMSGLLVSPFFLVIIITELLYSYAVHIDERAVAFEGTPP